MQDFDFPPAFLVVFHLFLKGFSKFSPLFCNLLVKKITIEISYEFSIDFHLRKPWVKVLLICIFQARSETFRR